MMKQIVDVDVDVYQEAREWLKTHTDWKFCGEVNNISHEEIVTFVNNLHQAGCESISITEYDWVTEPVYGGDLFQPDMLMIYLPAEVQKRQVIFEIVNNSFPELEAKVKYEDNGSDRLWYFFEPKPHKIVVGKKEITWYS